MANQLAAVAAPALVGVVLVLGSWRLAFAGASVAACVGTVVCYVVSGRMDLPEAGVEDREFLDAVHQQWPLILTGIAILGTAGLVWQGVFNFYVSYLVVERGLAEGTARNLLIVVFAAGVPAFFVTGQLADRFPPLPLLFTIVVSFVVCVFVFTSLSGMLALAVMSAVLGYVVHGLFPAIDSAVPRAVHTSRPRNAVGSDEPSVSVEARKSKSYESERTIGATTSRSRAHDGF